MFTAELLSLAIRVSLLLAAGYLPARLLERKSAAMAHRALVMTLACTLMLPLIVMTVPGWQWTQPTWMSIALIKVENTPAAGTAQVDRTKVDPSPVEIGENASESGGFPAFDLKSLITDSFESSIPGEAITSRTDTHPSLAANPLQSQSSQPNPLPSGTAASASPVSATSWKWADLGVSMWFVVASLLICRLLVSLIRLFAFVKRCTVAPSDIVTQAEETASQLRLKCRIRVVLSGPDAMPMACWLGRWIIVLPSNFMTWNAALREATLVHELGHIARRDAWSDMLAQGVFCVCWPNPLSWLCVQDVRRLRERACDEWALQRSAIDVKTYAQCLLEVVQRCQTQRQQFASTMAGKKDLESRLRWLMSSSRPRAARPVLTSVIVASITVLGLAIATAQPTRAQQTSAKESGQNGADAEPVQSEKLHEVIVSKDPSPADPAISVAGIVTDTDGKPLAGMEVVLCDKATSRSRYKSNLRRFPDVLARTTTNDQGRFAFNSIGIPPRMTDTVAKLRAGTSGAELLIWGTGKALTWEPVESFENTEKQIRLTPEADVRGIVVDDAGNPVENAELTVHGFTRSTNYVDPDLEDTGDLNLFWSEVQFGSTTNNGKFRIPNLPQNYRVALICTGENGGRSYFYIDTGKGGFETILYQIPSSRSAVEVHRNPITVSLTPRARVQIRIRDQHGKPVAGGIVEAVDEDRGFGGFARVNNEGIAVLGVHKPGIHQVYYSSDPLTPAIGVVQVVDIQPVESQIVEMKLVEHKWLTGKVVDQDTGAAIVGVYVWGWRIDSTDAVMPNSTVNLAVSGTDGIFRLPVVAGEWKLKLYGDVDGYFEDHEFSTGMTVGSANSVDVTVIEERVADDVVIKLGRGLVINGVLADFEGKPQAGVVVKAENEEPRGRRAATLTDESGRFHFSGFSPYSSVQISSWTESGSAEQVIYRNRNEKFTDRLIENIELEMYSGATLTGRLIKNGDPAQSVTVRLMKSLPHNGVPNKFQMVSEKNTDVAGNYTFNGLLKGDSYEIEIIVPGYIEIRDMSQKFGSTVKSHATIHVPDIRLVTNQQRLSGKVVDPEGNSVPGITVGASLKIPGDLYRRRNGEPPWNTSDEEGRFSLTDLPDEPITLMAYYGRNPAGGSIRYSVKAHPVLNAADIRIVYDPKLGSDIEDLDAK